jgi:hypothetical protein
MGNFKGGYVPQASLLTCVWWYVASLEGTPVEALDLPLALSQGIPGATARWHSGGIPTLAMRVLYPVFRWRK